MLISMEIEDFRRMAKDLGINWGDRYTLEKAIQKKAQPASDPIEQITMVESPTLETEVVESLLSEEPLEIGTQGKDAQSCHFCDMAKKSNNPQHKCRKCFKVVCNLKCSEQDPNSSNEMHQIHKFGHPECFSGSSFDCPYCDEKMDSQPSLQDHIDDKHTHPSFSSFSLVSNGTITDALLRCTRCPDTFENEYDLQIHMDQEDDEMLMIDEEIDAICQQQAQPSKSTKRKIDVKEQKEKKRAKKDDLNCTYCDKSFTRKDNMKRHVKTKH